MANAAPDSLHSLLRTLARLRAGYGQADGAHRAAEPQREAALRDVIFAEALLRNVVAADRGAAPLQVAVFGGTQVGKSTVINVLAGGENARVHHTAGFTRHAQAFLPPGTDDGFLADSFPLAFPRFRKSALAELTLDEPQAYAVHPAGRTPRLGNVVLWDAPDCDAVDSGTYLQGFLEAVTVADAVVYVTSREKYAVNVVLSWLLRLLQAGTPMTACLNMTPVAQQAELKQDMQVALDRYCERQSAPCAAHPVIIALDYAPEGDVSLLYGTDYAPSNQLRAEALRQAEAGRANLAARRAAAARCVRNLLPGILAPARVETGAWNSWNLRVRQASDDFVEDYRRYYLDDPSRYDAFARVGLEILMLLNPPVPGLAKALTAVRQVLSLPARALLYGGRALWRMAQGEPAVQGPKAPSEITTFHEAHGHLMNKLAAYVDQNRRSESQHNSVFWNALHDAWQAQVDNIHPQFESELAQHRRRGDEHIRETARAIYKELEKSPIKLNMLRTGRLAADAGAIVVSVKTGGHGDIVHDLVVAPILMSVVEAVSQQLAGSYVEQRRRMLKDQLAEDTREFVERVYGTRLRGLGQQAFAEAGFTPEDDQAFSQMEEQVAALVETNAGGSR